MQHKSSCGNYQLCYSLQGKVEQPLILFLHGFMGDRQEFSPIISQLTDQFCCLSVDLPGHGETRVLGGADGYTLPCTAAALIELLDRLAIGQCYSVGYSMGGRLALYLTLHYPNRVAKVLLESASPGLKTAAERSQRQQRDRQLADQLSTGDFPSFLRSWYAQPLFASLTTHPRFDALLQQRSNNNPHELAMSLRQAGTGTQPSLWTALEQATVPLLLLVGEQDHKFVAINQEMAQRCPFAQLAIIPGCGHNIHFEAATAFTQHLQAFLGTQ